jgi:inner membrane protein
MGTSIFSRPELIWFIIGLGLFLLELSMPGFIIFFFGLGAWVTALVCMIANPGTNFQIIIFAVSSVLSLVVLRRIIQKKFFYSNDSNPDSVDDEFTGKDALAIADFGPGKKGKVEFKGTTWDAESKFEVGKGQSVVIINKESIKLIVEPKNK